MNRLVLNARSFFVWFPNNQTDCSKVVGVSVPSTIETNNFFIILDDLVCCKCLLIRCQLSDFIAILVLEMQLRHPKPIASSSELLDFREVYIKFNQVFVCLFFCQE